MDKEGDTPPPTSIDNADGLLDNNSVDQEPHANTVKWHIGNCDVDRDFVQFITVYFLIFIIAVTSLANLSIKSEHVELWASLLSMMCGIIVPQPKYPKQRKENGHLHH